MTSQRGQALLELAIFGSFTIMLLGVLINYGLNADFNQEAMMDAHRTALALADVGRGGTGTGSSVVIKDRHLPSPSHPFGAGTIVPVVASSNVTRDYQTHLTPTKAENLPRMQIQIDGLPEPLTYRTAGFLDVPSVCGFKFDDNKKKSTNDPEKVGPIDRYEEIFGALSIVERGGTSKSECRPVRIVDPCQGEIISRDSCIRQARMMVSSGVCAQQCEKGKQPGDTKRNCGSICSQSIDISGVWYLQGYHAGGPGGWTFPALESMFAGIERMGVQPGYTKKSVMGYTLTKPPGPPGKTTSSGTWTETTTRTIVTTAGSEPKEKEAVKHVPAPQDASW